MKRIEEGQYQVTFLTLRQYPEEFFKYFLMSITSFDTLILLFGKYIQKQNTNMRMSITPEERLTVTIRIVLETCDVIWQILQPIEMAAPTTQDWLEISNGYFKTSQFPNCVGAVDGKHIRVECPKNNVGSYGKESDCNIFKISSFGKKLYSNQINFPPDNNLPGDDFGEPQPFVIVGDEAFALHNNLLRPFPGRALNDQRRIFNYRLSRARQTIECSFGILSQKWRVSQTSILVDPTMATTITKAWCVLHNFIRRRDGYNIKHTLSCPLERITERRGVDNS
ncbi:uncharacterized protein LOC111036531 [Myzus persicae]|uniref:uncharacterized protein LOC111036531 n=1 Tax=Myzus persicae TaxID=13164 RepID=UPI000B936840|nr:uncharacterized protein LOC111036531 [Myzus persicae]